MQGRVNTQLLAAGDDSKGMIPKITGMHVANVLDRFLPIGFNRGDLIRVPPAYNAPLEVDEYIPPSPALTRVSPPLMRLPLRRHQVEHVHVYGTVMMSSPEDRSGQREGVVSPASAGPEHVGKEISRLRRERNLTQSELAREISGLSSSYLQQIESGRTPGRQYFSALEEFFALGSGALEKIHSKTRAKYAERDADGLTRTQRFRGNEVSRAIGREIKRLRQMTDLSQVQLAAKVGISRTMIDGMEHGIVWGRKHYEALEKALDQRAEYFLTFKKTLEAKTHSDGSEVINPRIVDINLSALIAERIGKAVVHVRKTSVNDKFLAITSDGSVYEIVVEVKQVYEP